MALPIIDTKRYGEPIIAAGVLVGAVIPLVLWVFTGQIVWPPVVVGAAILAVYLVPFIIERLQDSGSMPSNQKSLRDSFPYNPETHYPVVRASICTGERVAGFRSKVDGRFTEVMLIRTAEDERTFMEAFGIESLKTEY